MVYNAYFHSIMNYDLISWWNSSQSANIFKKQKNIIIIITGCRSSDWRRDLFNSLKILPLQPQYILSLLLFTVNNKNKFKYNSDIKHIKSTQKSNFHQPSSNLSLYQKGVCSIIIKMFNHLPEGIKNFSDNLQHFESALKNYLLTLSTL
jgi:hypothetical protein